MRKNLLLIAVVVATLVCGGLVLPRAIAKGPVIAGIYKFGDSPWFMNE